MAGARLVCGAISGWRWADEDGDASKITASIARLVLELNGSTANMLITALGTNDYSAGTSAANVKARLELWTDAFHTQFPSAPCVHISPTTRANETTPNAGGSTLPQIRTAISDVCAARSSYCTYVDGSTLATYPTNFEADLLHMNPTGRAEYEGNLRALINVY